MPIDFVYENKDGAYLGVTEKFLDKFEQVENNPNFDVFYRKDGNTSFIAAKCSRLPDDEDLAKGKYGIDFNRAKPSLEEARAYRKKLPYALEKREYIGNLAFAASNEEEYKQKSSTYDSFYFHIFGSSPREVWVTQHSGEIKRKPDKILPYPKLEMDAFTAGVAALCAVKDAQKPSGRKAIFVHASNYLPSVIDVGGFGILNERKLQYVAKKIEKKYHERAQLYASKYRRVFSNILMKRLEHMLYTKGTFNPSAEILSSAERYDINNVLRGLKLYGQTIKNYELKEFEMVLENLSKSELKVITTNCLFPARHVGKLLRLEEKMKRGLLSFAIQIECSKLYLEKEPELMSEIILDIFREYI